MSTRLPIDQDALFRKITWRLIPFLFVLYVAAFLDRVNVGFAELQMQRDLSFGPAVFGFGSGIFFIGYFLFEVPSNLLLRRIGARATITRIMILWGIISSCMMFVRDEWTFYILRFLLGVAEAGFFPGVILYLTWWFPAEHRARAVSRFMTATAMAGVIGGPLSGYLLTWDGWHGLHGWQWLFLIEGIPSVLLGLSVWWCLPNRPDEVSWLTADEKRWLDERLAHEHEQALLHGTAELRTALADRRVWHVAAIYFCIVSGFYVVSMWGPQLIQQMGVSDKLMIGLYSSPLYMAAVIAMVIVGASSDRSGERRWHIIGSALIATIGVVGTAIAQQPLLGLIMLGIASMGIWSALGPMWSIPPLFLGGTAAAAGIGLINSLGNLGGFVGPYAIGAIKEQTGSFVGGLAFLGVLLLTGALLVWCLNIPKHTQHDSARS